MRKLRHADFPQISELFPTADPDSREFFMKYCPACRSQYTDPTLRFCLQDGAVLNDGDETQQSAIDTIAFSDPLTASSILKTADLNLHAPKSDAPKTRAWKAEPPKSALRQTPDAAKSNSFAKTFLAAAGVLLVLAAAGFGGWFYFGNQNKTANPLNRANDAAPETAQKNSTADNTKSKAVLDDLSAPVNSNTESSTNSGSEDAKKEIAAAIELWKQAAESRKLPDYLSRYADKVDYFDKTGASAGEIRTEAQKMFDTYSEIEITLSNVRVAVDAGGTQATAVFDKEWSYETPTDLLEGKAHTKLRFQKNGADWKITSEKYQKIYYMEN